MGTAERRREIMIVLCRRRYDTMHNLASEFGVSVRTIQRDIESLSISEPIYTQSGKYGGGVYITEGYSLERMYMKAEEIAVLHKLLEAADNNPPLLSSNEKETLRTIINQYTKPQIQHIGGKNERK